MIKIKLLKIISVERILKLQGYQMKLPLTFKAWRRTGIWNSSSPNCS